MTTTQRAQRIAARTIALAAAILACMGVWGGIPAHAAQPPVHPRHTAAQTYTQHLHALAAQVRAHGRPCAVEDASEGPLPCYWDAGTAGNGRGTSFVALNGGVTADGFQRVIYVYADHVERGGWGI